MNTEHQVRNLNRRSFLTLAVLGTAELVARSRRSAVFAAPAQVPPLGVQLYTVRELLLQQPFETLKVLAEMGYTEVECSRRDLNLILPILKQVGLRFVSIHIETPLVTGNRKPWQEGNFPLPPEGYDFSAALAEARQHGIKYLVVTYLLPQERGGISVYGHFCEQMNRAGEQCQKAGLTLCYHNHAFEFEPLDNTTVLA